MTELAFLVDLLLNHKLPKATRDAVAERIKEVENGICERNPMVAAGRGNGGGVVAAAAPAIPPHLVGQSASTIAAMMRHEQAGAAPAVPVAVPDAAVVPPTPPPPPVVNVAQTPAAAMAMSKRQQAINAQVSGKPIEGETRPRKW